jgi:acetyl-CoA acetyltransferase
VRPRVPAGRLGELAVSVRGRVAIVGAAETDHLGVLPDTSAIQLHAEAALNAIRDCGIDRSEIDGFAAAGQSPIAVAHYLGLTPRWLDGTAIGGCSFLVHVRHASAAIAAGLCEVVLITHGESGRSRVGMPSWPRDPASIQGQFEVPYGITGPPTMFPIGVLRYMREFGLTHEQLASVAVAQRRWASRNPRAYKRELITVDDVLASPLIAYPMHLLECCLVTDGGGALVLTSAERAAAMDLPHPAVYVLGTGESAEAQTISMMEDFTTSRAFRVSSRSAFQEAGIGPADVDHLMVYDAFAHLPIYGLEDLGFVGRGEAGAFIAEGNTEPGGRLPMNTNGGGLSYTHTGMYGMFAIQESVRQLRGQAPAQVPDVNVSVAQGVGGMFMSAGTLVLGTAAAAGA